MGVYIIGFVLPTRKGIYALNLKEVVHSCDFQSAGIIIQVFGLAIFFGFFGQF